MTRRCTSVTFYVRKARWFGYWGEVWQVTDRYRVTATGHRLRRIWRPTRRWATTDVSDLWQRYR